MAARRKSPKFLLGIVFSQNEAYIEGSATNRIRRKSGFLTESGFFVSHFTHENFLLIDEFRYGAVLASADSE